MHVLYIKIYIKYIRFIKSRALICGMHVNLWPALALLFFSFKFLHLYHYKNVLIRKRPVSNYDGRLGFFLW